MSSFHDSIKHMHDVARGPAPKTAAKAKRKPASKKPAADTPSDEG